MDALSLVGPAGRAECGVVLGGRYAPYWSRHSARLSEGILDDHLRSALHRRPVGPRVSGGVIEVRSSHDGSLVGHAAEATTADVDRAVAAARTAFDEGPWPRMRPEERQVIVARFDELHLARAAEIAELITAENGSPHWFTSMLQTAVSVQTQGFLRGARELAWEERRPAAGSGHTVVRHEPVGVVAAVIPWNAPHQSALAKLIPALLAGCTVVLKPSPETALDGLLLGELFAEAGFPDGVLSIVPGGREIGAHLVAHPDIDKIAFTGSTGAGRAIAGVAAETFKRVTLELGGKSAAIVLEDADLDAVVSGNRVPSYIELGIQEGARLVAGGPEIPEGLETGHYVRPTVFADVDNSTRIAREEIFGPVLVVIPFDDEDDAVRIANDSPYGLSGAVWTADLEHRLEIARHIRTGTLQVNGAATDLAAPFEDRRVGQVGSTARPGRVGEAPCAKLGLPLGSWALQCTP
ncbi:aldehyde dehydrogenase family protein [Streptomyces sp. NPDC086077]|uniref:aldehyde dehydrogenase family protein n=1 Tax=Streptomyces sp. NPDC086077 TaxID=3154862 RepID=UPI00343A8F4F